MIRRLASWPTLGWFAAGWITGEVLYRLGYCPCHKINEWLDQKGN